MMIHFKSKKVVFCLFIFMFSTLKANSQNMIADSTGNQKFFLNPCWQSLWGGFSKSDTASYITLMNLFDSKPLKPGPIDEEFLYPVGQIIQFKLQNPTLANKRYYFEFMFKLKNQSSIRNIDKAGISFSNRDIFEYYNTGGKNQKPIYMKPIAEVSKANFEYLNDGWIRASTIVNSPGVKKYIQIFTCKNTNCIAEVVTGDQIRGKTGAYNLSLKWPLLFEVSMISMADSLTQLATGYSFAMNNILFRTGTAVISDSSLAQLWELEQLMKKKPTLKIEISGHTDNIGNDTDNQILSEARAKAVADYLISKGILKERLTSTGYGNRKPVSTNDTEAGRKLNRRVEFEVKGI